MRPPPNFPSSPYPLLAGGGVTATARDNPVVSLAAQYLGVPYKWGGASPRAGFDCSGLVKYVFAQLGVSLPHYAAAQYYSTDAVWVSPSLLQPGDLVFFTGSDGSRKAPGHVGIYIGDGYLIDAPHTGSFVRIDSLDERWFANKYVGANRIAAPLQARHLLHATKRGASVPNKVFPQHLAAWAFAGSPPGRAAARTAHASATRSYGLWTGVGLGGALLLLCPGGIVYRRRDRAPKASSSRDTSD